MNKQNLCVIALSALLCGACRKTAPEIESAAKTLVTVKVARAVLADVDLSIDAPAIIFPRERANISSSITAPIRVLHARKGDTVAKDQILALLEDRDLVAQKGEAVAAVNQAQVLLERRSQLFAQGAIPQRDLLATQTDFAQSQARLQRIEALSRFTVLRSPFAGTIVEQFLYVGDMVKPDTPVFTVVDLAVAIARAQVPESDVGGVQKGQMALFVPQDVASVERPKLEGRITMINQAVDPARRTVEVWCEIPNREAHLRDGAFGRLNIVTAHRPRRIVVPRTALQLTEGGHKGTVVVVDADQHAHIREIATAGFVGALVAISQGLAEGETVVTEGGYGLPEGSPVRFAEVPVPGVGDAGQ
jgi:RND family efflux transporter MFP subunit